MQAMAGRGPRGLGRLGSLGLALALSSAALLLLGRWAGGAAAAGNPLAPAAAANPAAAQQPAATFNVTATADSDDNNLADGHCHDVLNGGCSLRAAVQQLDHDSGGTINLPAGTFKLTNNGDGDLTLVKDISVIGADPATTLIQGNPITWTHRILAVQNGANVTVRSVTLSGGSPTGQNGGGIDVISGTLTLITSVVMSNTAAGEGGGIYNSGVLIVAHSTLHGNHSNGDGGGLSNAAGASATVNSSEVTNNTAPANGGGLYNLGDMAITNSDISYNVAGVSPGNEGQGGGVANLALGTLSIAGSTLSDNTLYGTDGAGLANVGHNLTSTTVIVNSTIDGNRAIFGAASPLAPAGFGILGVGIVNFGSHMDLSNVTVTSNTAQGFANGGGIFNNDQGTLTLRNTIVALNATPGGMGPDCGGALNSQGYNLIQNTADCYLTSTITSTTVGNITGHDPQLKPLGAYGGLALTREPLAGSPVLDAGSLNLCRDSLGNLLTTDERSLPRLNGPRCDIGAVEGLSPLPLRLLLPLLGR